VYDFDETKLTVNVCGLGYSGYEVKSILRKEYNIQIELSDIYNILAVISIGDRRQDLESFVNALKDIASKSKIRETKKFKGIPYNPSMVVPSRDAFYSPKKIVTLENSIGEIAGEMVMASPRNSRCVYG
jgi:arginine decarboxylase